MAEHRAGPVRSEAARVAILDATSRLFAARGFAQLTMEGIASEAGVSKQTIYRWWGSKGALVADCLLEGVLVPIIPAPEDSGNLRQDLVHWLTQSVETLDQLGGDDFLRSLVVAAAGNAEVGERLQHSLGIDESLTARLRSAVDAADLAADAHLPEIGEALIGAVILRVLSRSSVREEGLMERLVEVVLG